MNPLTSSACGDVQEKMAQMITQMWKKTLGMKTCIESYEWKHLLTKLKNKECEITGITWTPWVDDPFYTLEIFQNSNHPINFCNWFDAKFRDLIEKNKTKPLQERQQIYAELENRLLQKFPMIPLVFEKKGYVASSCLKGFYRAEAGRLEFEYASKSNPFRLDTLGREFLSKEV